MNYDIQMTTDELSKRIKEERVSVLEEVKEKVESYFGSRRSEDKRLDLRDELLIQIAEIGRKHDKNN